MDIPSSANTVALSDMDSTNQVNAAFADKLRTVAFHPDDQRAWQVLQVCPRYQATPLLCMNDDGVGVRVKDESRRLGLGSFKALGGIYAVAQLLADKVEKETGARPLAQEILEDSVKAVAAKLTFVCASAGNHGLAVATGARIFGAQAAEAVGGVLLADGSWQGYTYPPSLVMEGYTAIARELHDQFSAKNRWPSDVYLQAGVGGMAAAVTLMIRKYWPTQPRIVIVEPAAADCLAISASAGKLVDASGPASNMGRLDCKAASLLAFDSLSVCDVEYLTISDNEAEVAVRSLDYLGLATSPSGAAGFAAWQRDRALDRSAGQQPLIIMSEQAIA